MVIFFSAIFVAMFYAINALISRKSLTANKVSAYECGFATVGKIQSRFRIHFIRS